MLAVVLKALNIMIIALEIRATWSKLSLSIIVTGTVPGAGIDWGSM